MRGGWGHRGQILPSLGLCHCTLTAILPVYKNRGSEKSPGSYTAGIRARATLPPSPSWLESSHTGFFAGGGLEPSGVNYCVITEEALRALNVDWGPTL